MEDLRRTAFLSPVVNRGKSNHDHMWWMAFHFINELRGHLFSATTGHIGYSDAIGNLEKSL